MLLENESNVADLFMLSNFPFEENFVAIRALLIHAEKSRKEIDSKEDGGKRRNMLGGGKKS